MFFLISLLFSLSANANTLHFRLASSPITLDWTGQVAIGSATIVMNLCEGLFDYEHPSEKLIPAIASSIKKSKDLTEYTFQIKEDAKWSDGRSIYAQDFVDGWQRLLSPQTTSIYSYYLFDIVNAREYNSKKISSFDEVGIHAKADKTLVVKFNHPQKNWESTTTSWALFPVRKDLIEKFGNNWWRAGTLLSSGPFVLSSFEPGKNATLKRNPYYRKTKSNVDQIEIDFILDQEVAIKKYEKNIYPFISGIRGNKYFKNKDFRPIPILRHYVLAMNTERFPFNNKNFRLAVLSSIDRSKIMSGEYSQFTLATELVPPALTTNKEDLSTPFDPIKAKEYFEKSGIKLGNGFKISFLTGLFDPFYEVSKKIAEQIESTLGIPVDTFAHKSQEYENFIDLGEYNILMMSWTAMLRTPQDFLFPYSSEYSTHNRSHYNNDDYNQAIDNGNFTKAQLIISKENAVVYPLFFEKIGLLFHSNIKNLYFDHRGLPLLKDVILVLK